MSRSANRGAPRCLPTAYQCLKSGDKRTLVRRPIDANGHLHDDRSVGRQKALFRIAKLSSYDFCVPDYVPGGNFVVLLAAPGPCQGIVRPQQTRHTARAPTSAWEGDNG